MVLLMTAAGCRQSEGNKPARSDSAQVNHTEGSPEKEPATEETLREEKLTEEISTEEPSTEEPSLEGDSASGNLSNGSEDDKGNRLITDMAGREVLIENRIEKIYSTGQPGVVMLYTLCPDKLLGWCMKLSREEAKYIDPRYLSLPVLGLMQGNNNTANKEEIMRRNPDMVLFMTDIAEDTIESADEMQEMMGIPVVVADYHLDRLSDTYQFLGEILKETKRADELSAYCKDTVTQAIRAAAAIPMEERKRIYYAQGSTGMQTAPKGSSHSEVIDLVGGENTVILKANTDGRLTINMEQLLIYNPDIIIASYSMGHNNTKKDAFSIITNGSKEWKLLDAVKNGMIFNTPAYPYNWLDMPPSVNRIIGIKWMGNLLYPDYYPFDMKEEVLDFYQLFYNKKLSQEELNLLLGNAVREG